MRINRHKHKRKQYISPTIEYFDVEDEGTMQVHSAQVTGGEFTPGKTGDDEEDDEEKNDNDVDLSKQGTMFLFDDLVY